MNVVWAKPYSSDDKGTENRLSGHAAGKTTLCRFIRYLFGEHHFASESVEQSIRESEAFRYSWVVAEVRVEGVTWSVGKPFSQPSRGLCKENCTLDEFLRMGSERSAFSVIEKKLQEILKEITPIQKFDDGSSLSFWQLFPWFTRDQECQFMDLDSWRNNPKSGAESPFLSRERAMLAVRSTFDKTIAKEIELLTLQAQLAREKEDAERALMVIDKMLDKDGEVGASLGLTIGDGSLWDDQSVKKLEEKLSQNDFVSEVSPMLDDVEGRLKTLLEQRASLQSLSLASHRGVILA